MWEQVLPINRDVLSLLFKFLHLRPNLGKRHCRTHVVDRHIGQLKADDRAAKKQLTGQKYVLINAVAVLTSA